MHQTIHRRIFLSGKERQTKDFPIHLIGTAAGTAIKFQGKSRIFHQMTKKLVWKFQINTGCFRNDIGIEAITTHTADMTEKTAYANFIQQNTYAAIGQADNFHRPLQNINNAVSLISCIGNTCLGRNFMNGDLTCFQIRSNHWVNVQFFHKILPIRPDSLIHIQILPFPCF